VSGGGLGAGFLQQLIRLPACLLAYLLMVVLVAGRPERQQQAPLATEGIDFDSRQVNRAIIHLPPGASCNAVQVNRPPRGAQTAHSKRRH